MKDVMKKMKKDKALLSEAYKSAGALPSKASTKTVTKKARKTKTDDKVDAQTPQPKKSRKSNYSVSSAEKPSRQASNDEWWDEVILKTRIGRALSGNIRTYLLGLTESSNGKFKLITEITQKN